LDAHDSVSSGKTENFDLGSLGDRFFGPGEDNIGDLCV